MCEGLAEKRDELYQVKKNFFLPSFISGQAPPLSPLPQNFQEGKLFWNYWLAGNKTFLTKKLKRFPKLFFWKDGGGVVFWGDLTYVEKIDYFWGSYRNGKLICTYGAFRQKENSLKLHKMTVNKKRHRLLAFLFS